MRKEGRRQEKEERVEGKRGGREAGVREEERRWEREERE